MEDSYPSKYYTVAQKKSILKWRNQNHEKYNEYMNNYHKSYYQDHAEAFRIKRMEIYYFQKEWKRLANICL